MKPLATLMDGVPVRLMHGSRDVPVRVVTDDSRQVVPGSLFVARSGHATDGRRFIDDAIGRGATAVLAAGGTLVSRDVALLEPTGGIDVAAAGGLLAETLHDRPSRELAVIAVTGTNGKTTTAHLIRRLLVADGSRCGLIGTVGIHDGVEDQPAALTTPDAFEISGLLRRMVDRGCTACVMEASSHALSQHRLAGIEVAGAVFTNLSGDHLDYHGTMEDYLQAKLRLVRMLEPSGWLVTNDDDPAGRRAAEICAAGVLSCSIDRADAACRGSVIRVSADGAELRFDGPWGALETTVPLVGRHNAMNALQAAAAAWRMGVDLDTLQRGLHAMTSPPGRLERVSPEDAPYTVFVDYAHTDDALANVLSAVRPLVPSGGFLRVVFGCGGDRDRTKRPRMAEAAWRFADDVIVTSDNPRTEDPQTIIDEVMTGVPPKRRAATAGIVDRRAAIETVVRRSGPGDIVVIAGKGHEDYQIIGTQRRSFDDRDVARMACRQRMAEPHDVLLQ